MAEPRELLNLYVVQRAMLKPPTGRANSVPLLGGFMHQLERITPPINVPCSRKYCSGKARFREVFRQEDTNNEATAVLCPKHAQRLAYHLTSFPSTAFSAKLPDVLDLTKEYQP